MILLASILAVIMVAAAIWVLITPNILNAIIVFAVVSLVASVLFIFMHAPDVAITEASIGAGITSALFILAYKRISE
ncbi:MAG: DUF4040 domain-containing protein [Peptostreptococcaceae bacterium]|nr:DUF4040 domain-containing protein [Peptostreptococcaceae bacterium]